MNRWRQSVVEIQTRKRQVNECERAQAALSKVTACFQQMATSLGSNMDGSFLREELEETRTVAHKICSGKTSRKQFVMQKFYIALSVHFCSAKTSHIQLRHIHTVDRLMFQGFTGGC